MNLLATLLLCSWQRYHPNLTESLAMTLIGNIITGTVCSQPTYLQVALGVLIRRNKILISELSKYSVCCSYDEVRLFRYSAAVRVAQNYDEVGFGVCDRNIVKHCIYNYFDAEILSPNCKRCVHCLALIMAQVRPSGISSLGEVAPKRKTIKRQLKQGCSKPVKYDVQQETYNGPKKSLLHPEQAFHHVPLSLPKQPLNNEHWKMNLHSCRIFIWNRSVLNSTGTSLDCVAKPACSLNQSCNKYIYFVLE